MLQKQPTPYPKPNRYYTTHFKSTIHILVYIFVSGGTTKTQHLSNFNHAIPKTLTLIIRIHSMSLHTISTNQITNYSTCHTKFWFHRIPFITIETQYSPKSQFRTINHVNSAWAPLTYTIGRTFKPQYQNTPTTNSNCIQHEFHTIQLANSYT